MLKRIIVFVALCLTPVSLNAVHSKAQQEQTFFKITYLETRHHLSCSSIHCAIARSSAALRCFRFSSPKADLDRRAT
jgi:hypothetical protein